MQKSCCLSFLMFFLLIAFSRRSLRAQAPLAEFGDSLFQVAVDSHFIAGGAALVVRGDEVLLDRSYGYASLELEVPMPANASFEIGSVTKQFTAAAIVKLHQMDKLSLDDDLTKYIDIDTKGRSIPIWRLLDHTSGIASYTEMPAFWPMSLHRYERDSMVRMVEAEEFLFEPGEALIYNNSAYFFLGLIIEKASGKPYEDFLQEQIFDPLQMNDTYYCSNTQIVKGKAYGYNFSPGGLQQKPYLDHTWPYAAGSLCSTTADLLKWLKAIHQDDFLGKEAYEMMITPRPLNDGTKVKYAMGLVNESYFGQQMIHHGGGIHGFLSETRYFPQEDLTVICLVNTTGPRGGGFFADQLTWQVLDQKYPPRVPVDVDMKKLEGIYAGQVRGRQLQVEVKIEKGQIRLYQDGGEDAEALDHYIGNSTWWDDGQELTIAGDKMQILEGYSYYVLKRE